MPNLPDLPVELLDAILEHLYIVDSATFLLSQATNKRFRDVAKRILSRPYFDYGPRFVKTNLQHKFYYLFYPLVCITPDERKMQNGFYLTIAGDHLLPFKRLSWAQTALSRQAYLRSEASWRNLSITTPCRKPITRFEIIREYSCEIDGGFILYSRLDLLDRGILTLGLLYDTLLDENVHFGNETGEWHFHEGVRLRDYDLLLEYGCFIVSDDRLVDDSKDSEQCAILYIEGSMLELGTPIPSFSVDHDWEPTMIGPDRLRFLDWEGQNILG